MEYGSTILAKPNDTVAVRIKGMSSSYPPEISAIKKMAVIGLLAGTCAMAAAMVVANLFITPAFMGVERAVVWQLMPFIVAFNLVKAGINSVVTFLLYKRISPFLHK